MELYQNVGIAQSNWQILWFEIKGKLEKHTNPVAHQWKVFIETNLERAFTLTNLDGADMQTLFGTGVTPMVRGEDSITKVDLEWVMNLLRTHHTNKKLDYNQAVWRHQTTVKERQSSQNRGKPIGLVSEPIQMTRRQQQEAERTKVLVTRSQMDFDMGTPDLHQEEERFMIANSKVLNTIAHARGSMNSNQKWINMALRFVKIVES
jgi:hypothetical protein